MIRKEKQTLKLREKIRQTLVYELMGQKEVLGCYEGGSTAFDRADEWSDLDLGIVVQDGFVQGAVQLLEQAMQKVSPIEERLILPQPTWHGHWQGFYRLQGSSPFLLLDILVMQESSRSYFTEVELHGRPIVFFDKTGRLGREHIDRKELEKQLPQRLERIRKLSRLFHCFIDKEILRRREIDAFDLYYNLILRSLVELLRIKYDPERWSWGLRYLNSVLPPKLYDEVRNLSYVQDLQDLQLKKDRAMQLLNSLLHEDWAKARPPAK
jgi:hypothetical protein